MKKIITKSEKETFNLAKRFALDLAGGEIIGLVGDLGAGKTIFAKGLAAGLGIKRTVNSPTFVLMKLYKVKNHPTIKQLCHIDAYRSQSLDELINIGVAEYLNKKDTITVIEWVEKTNFSRKNKYSQIKILHRNLNQRKIIFS
jgi:tRNA threonylcarbamoyladenosine biosynthesis protein TsaE